MNIVLSPPQTPPHQGTFDVCQVTWKRQVKLISIRSFQDGLSILSKAGRSSKKKKTLMAFAVQTNWKKYSCTMMFWGIIFSIDWCGWYFYFSFWECHDYSFFNFMWCCEVVHHWHEPYLEGRMEIIIHSNITRLVDRTAWLTLLRTTPNL